MFIHLNSFNLLAPSLYSMCTSDECGCGCCLDNSPTQFLPKPALRKLLTPPARYNKPAAKQLLTSEEFDIPQCKSGPGKLAKQLLTSEKFAIPQCKSGPRKLVKRNLPQCLTPPVKIDNPTTPKCSTPPQQLIKPSNSQYFTLTEEMDETSFQKVDGNIVSFKMLFRFCLITICRKS